MFLSYLNICLKLISFKVVDTVHVHLFCIPETRRCWFYLPSIFSSNSSESRLWFTYLNKLSMWGISLMNYYYFFYITLCIFTGNKYMLIRRNFTFVFYTSISTQNVVIIQLYRLTYQPNFADFTIKYFTNKLTAKTAQINLVQQYLQFSPL